MYDVVVIGAGVIGAAIARELSKFNLNIALLDRENDVACGTTKANSAIIHAGFDASYDSKKGLLNARGNFLFDQVAEELKVPFKRIGSYVVAFSDEEVETLNELLENGKKLGIPGLSIINKETLYSKEPNIQLGAVAALHAPTAGIIEPWELAIAYAENAIDNGVSLFLNAQVTAIHQEKDVFVVECEEQSFTTKLVINCAGVYADQIYNMVVSEPEFSITPRRGQYFLLDKSAHGLVNSVIFPCPTKLGKGTLVVPTVDHNILVGPDSEDLSLEEKESIQTTGERLQLVKDMASKLVVNIPYRENITTFAGLRAESSTGDFIIEESPQVKNFINVAGIKSPGLSASPAIAEYTVNIVESILQPTVNPQFNGLRRARIKFHELSTEEKQKMIQDNPLYGRVICRCESITEGEIIDAIHRPAGARTVNGIKRRVRPGAGRCQGGFCGPRVIEILARELKLDPMAIEQEARGTNVLISKTKANESEVNI